VGGDRPVAVLWTGGWDSTFRICQLLDGGAEVLPVYLASALDMRKNQMSEIVTMQALRPLLRKRFPRSKVLPTMHVGRPGDHSISHGIPGDHLVTAAAKQIGYGGTGKERMGRQYEAFCRFAKHFGEMELCIEVGGRAEKLLRSDVVDTPQGIRLKPYSELTDKALEIFRPFVFPLIRSTKAHMLAVSEEREYLPILKRTWSCWFPQKNGSPCGRCEMCIRRAVPAQG